MKYIKTFKLFESSDDEMLDFLIFLEELEKVATKNDNEFSYQDFYVKQDGNIINIDCGWSSPEEGADRKMIINLDNLTIRETEDAHTVYGSYENDNTYTYKSIEDIKKYLSDRFS